MGAGPHLLAVAASFAVLLALGLLGSTWLILSAFLVIGGIVFLVS